MRILIEENGKVTLNLRVPLCISKLPPIKKRLPFEIKGIEKEFFATLKKVIKENGHFNLVEIETSTEKVLVQM